MQKLIVKQPTTKAESTPNLTITPTIDQYLISQAKNFLKGKHLGGDYTYGSVSDLVRRSLELYQQQKLVLTTTRNLTNPRQKVAFYLTPPLATYYRNLPQRHRTEILERCLASFLVNI
ncbi:MAG: hypothetical protein MRERV_3c099 [Mycoplasmataceae bacterium RV_VA103A]|nr:MAG: hypothetical protein MRERV_3c099 [Mycoplasmataceae bacterium RV_VA103A]